LSEQTLIAATVKSSRCWTTRGIAHTLASVSA